MARNDNQIKAPKYVMLASICVVCAALYLAQSVLIPLALALLLSFLLAPMVTRLEKRGLHRVPAVVVVVTLLFSLLGLLTWAVALQVTDFAEQLPSYKGNIVAKIRSVHLNNVGGLGKAAKAIEEMRDAVSTNATTQPGTGSLKSSDSSQPVLVRIWQEPSGALDTVSTYAGSVINQLGFAGIVIVFVIFMLLQREDLRDRLIRLVGEGQLHIATDALDDAAGRISRYLSAQAVVNGTYGLAISLGLYVIGYSLGGKLFPSFLLWGLLCGLLRFIPYIGPWIAAVFPIAVSFAVFPGYAVFVAVVGMFVIVELLSNNIMEPWLYGASTGMSTMAIIAAAVFWTWLWGPIGLLLSTPMTVCIVVIGKYVPQLAFLDILLGDQPVLEPHQRFYQRLLATDVDEASALAEDYVQKHSLEEMYDEMVLPALGLGEQDRLSGRLDEARGMAIRHAIRELVEDFGDEEKIKQVRQAASDTARAARNEQPKTSDGKVVRKMLQKDCSVRVVCLPAHDEADEIVGLMLAQLLELRGYQAMAVSHNALASEMLDEVEKREAQIICVSALPPAAVAHARYLIKRLMARFPTARQLIGLWTATGDLERAAQRLSIVTEEKIPMTIHLLQAIEQIERMAEPMVMAGAQQPQATLSSSSPQHRP
jgi:predicted PurR-regulated permease PerM